MPLSRSVSVSPPFDSEKRYEASRDWPSPVSVAPTERSSPLAATLVTRPLLSWNCSESASTTSRDSWPDAPQAAVSLAQVPWNRAGTETSGAAGGVGAGVGAGAGGGAGAGCWAAGGCSGAWADVGAAGGVDWLQATSVQVAITRASGFMHDSCDGASDLTPHPLAGSGACR